MSRSVRRCGRYGAAEKGAKIRSRWGWRCRGKGGAPRRKGAKAGEWRRGLPAFRQSAENRGNFAADVSADRGLGNVDAVGGQSARSTRQERPRGSTCLPCCCRRRQGATFRGISGLGDMAPRLSFSPGDGAPWRQNLGLGEGGRLVKAGAERAETRRHLKRRAFGGVAVAQGRGVRRGGRAGACVPGAKNRSLRKSAAARGRGAAGRVSPEGGRPAED